MQTTSSFLRSILTVIGLAVLAAVAFLVFRGQVGRIAAQIESASNEQEPSMPTEQATEPEAAPKARTPREGTKQATLIAMLRAPKGATIEEIMAATSWQSHTVRGAMAGALKKKLGLEVTSEKVEGRGRVYRLPAA